MTVEPTTDPQTLALLRNDLRGMTRDAMGALVAALTERMGVDAALAPIDLITDKNGAIRVYINARGAAELAKRHELSDDELTVDIRETPPVVIVKVAKSAPDGRMLRDVGASSYWPDRPDSLARSIKSAATSAHRRATLRMVGIFISEPADPGAVDTDA
jgi:hypothetical protein